MWNKLLGGSDIMNTNNSFLAPLAFIILLISERNYYVVTCSKYIPGYISIERLFGPFEAVGPGGLQCFEILTIFKFALKYFCLNNLMLVLLGSRSEMSSYWYSIVLVSDRIGGYNKNDIWFHAYSTWKVTIYIYSRQFDMTSQFVELEVIVTVV